MLSHLVQLLLARSDLLFKVTSFLVQALDLVVLGFIVEFEVAERLLGLSDAGLDLSGTAGKQVTLLLGDILGCNLVADLGGPGLKLALLLLDGAAELFGLALQRVADLFELSLFALERSFELVQLGLFLFDFVRRV